MNLRFESRKLLVIALVVLALTVCAAAQTATPLKSTCIDCHSALDGQFHVTAEQFSQDIHAQKGLTCASCHGGDPNADDDKAMSKAAGFKGHIDRAKVPELCGSCHSDANFMRQYNPSLRTDQLAQYRTSQHGKKLASGDANVAVCTDCHGVHNLRPPSDPQSSVYAVNIANTCSKCHSDAQKMKPYGIPTNQFASYSSSVHHEAMSVRGDLSAPTCTTCHGNHGATPPGVATVENVCSTCHVFQAQLFDTSPHKAAFASAGMPGCVTCHSNHRIEHPSDKFLAAGPQGLCTNCHSDGDAGFKAAMDMHAKLGKLEASILQSQALLDKAADLGIEVSQDKLQLTQAQDSLTKARVTLHTFQPKKVDADIAAGTTIADKSLVAAQNAIHESKFRRAGLGVSLLTVLAVLAGLTFFIRDYERRPK